MKKFTFLAAIAISMIMALPANAQVKFGLKGGLNVTSMSLSGEELTDPSNRTGFFVGPTVKFTLPIVGLGFDASVLYDQRSADVKNKQDIKKEIKQQSVNIPINLRYGFGLSSMASAFIFAGPQFGFNVGDKEYKWDDKSNYTLKKSNLSINVGLGVTFIDHLQLSANYNIACGKTADVSVIDVAKKLKSHNNAWQIGLAYYF